MEKVIAWVDYPRNDVDHKILTEKEMGIPGLRTFGWLNKHQLHEAPQTHFHANAFEIAYVLSGQLKLYCHGKEYTIHGGEAFIARPNEIHGTNGIPYAACELFWIQLTAFPGDEACMPVEDLLFLNETGAQCLIKRLENIQEHIIQTDNGQITNLIQKLLQHVWQEEISSGELAAHLVSILYMLLEFAKRQRQISPEMKMVCLYIQSHLQEEITMDMLAEIAGVSESSLKHRFKREIGTPPGKYIMQCRIEEIKQILHPQSVMTEIALRYGFSSSSHFAAVFKKHVGCTPTEYIKKKQKGAQSTVRK